MLSVGSAIMSASVWHKPTNKLASAVEARSSGESAFKGGLSQNIFNTALANLFIGSPYEKIHLKQQVDYLVDLILPT